LPDLQPSDDAIEKFCSRVPAEVLIPTRQPEACWPQVKASNDPYNALARRFKGSEIVAARRVLDHGLISHERFYTFLNAYRADEKRKAARKPSGGDFYRTQDVRVGHRFGSAVIRAARSGRLLYKDAYQLTGFYGRTFDQFAQELGFSPV
jgi:Zn-dependent peptidase ImmA (M78 family)